MHTKAFEVSTIRIKGIQDITMHNEHNSKQLAPRGVYILNIQYAWQRNMHETCNGPKGRYMKK